jgi:epoxyqueuosine reductase QueG
MTVTKNISLEDQIKQLALDKGAVLVGICSADSINEKEASDPTYLLPEAQSVISIAINLNPDKIYPFLSKEARDPFVEHQDDVYKNLKRIGEKIKIFLEDKGFKAVNCDLNFDYRYVKKDKNLAKNLETFVNLIDKDKDENIQLTEKEKGMLERMNKMVDAASNPKNAKENNIKNFVPTLSHKCVAVAAGLGRVGWSGNLVTEKYGARVLLNSIITDAELKPDKIMEENPCNKCKLCEKACQSGLFARKNEEQKITIAGVEETIGKRSSIAYCAPICGGMIGQNKFKEWSTWSPYRLKEVEFLPSDDLIDEFCQNLIMNAIREGGVKAKHMLVQVKSMHYGLHNKPKGQYVPTCACCQLICGPTIQERKKSYKLLKDGGCVELGGKWDPEYCLK